MAVALWGLTLELAMPGKCKFQDAWLEKDIYRDWLMRDVHDIHSARCRACCKFIKLQTMGEAALTSHAGGAGHKAAVCKLMEAQALYRSQNTLSVRLSPADEGSTPPRLPSESNLLSINSAGQVKGTFWPEEEKPRPGLSQPEELKDPPPESLEWSDNKNSISQNPELQDPGFTATFITATGCPTKRPCRRGRPPSKPEPADAGMASGVSPLEQQRNMALLEWEGRMRSLSQEHELLTEKRRATRQKERAYRLKKRYYRAKLRRLGEEVPSSSDSERDEEQMLTTAHRGLL
ncbi:uncharacterized protein LOC110156038 isoform X2 [Boleophthalmus pectinirostris]|uniref:uncharacterized protein LOC110156038 isoform X2 n=1 Tax=Boleophthalmus pectinirostris TaxID=150288 RepID=UPI00242C44BB|nr:uncharacterized protein LOC110156038 isoform X2 [Boleophthalmus pectinirostris]